MPKYNLLIVGCLLFTAFSKPVQAEKFRVYFEDKCTDNFNPAEYFHPKALERRAKAGLPAYNQSDLPVCEDYIRQVKMIMDSSGVLSRWLNMMVVYGSEKQAEQIAVLPFVLKIERVHAMPFKLAAKEIENPLDSGDLALLEDQLDRMGAPVFNQANLNGKGVRVAVFDAGFTDVDVHPAFSHLEIAEAWDFVGNDDNPYHGSSHGNSTLSCIGGRYGDTKIGLADGAVYLLARTERNNFEFKSEEEHWLAAVEWADKHGADVINSSLGYTRQRYFVEDLDGTNGIVSQAAMMAFRKGIMVVNSAGNEGDNKWKYIGAPADADSIISVGGIDPRTDLRISFSSYGPTSDGRLTPLLTAYGKAVTAVPNGGYGINFGTSFSSPLVAGFVACLIEAFPNMSQHDMYEKLKECGHLYPYFDYAHGYGIPQASKAQLPGAGPASIGLLPFFLQEKEGALYFIMAENREPENDDMLYLHLQTADGILLYYKVYKVREKEFKLDELDGYGKGDIIRAHLGGYTQTFTIR